MNAKLSPGILAIALLIGTVYGPLVTLKDVTRDSLTSLNYWLDLASAGLRSFATTGISLVAVVGAALGLPMWQTRKDAAPPVAPPP
jgi:hypothetical protein